MLPALLADGHSLMSSGGMVAEHACWSAERPMDGRARDVFDVHAIPLRSDHGIPMQRHNQHPAVGKVPPRSKQKSLPREKVRQASSMGMATKGRSVAIPTNDPLGGGVDRPNFEFD
jgi:hypothetical protein